MLTFFSPLHAGHHVQQFIRYGRIVEGRDVPARADNIAAAVRAAGHEIRDAPDHGMAPIAAIHTPEYLDFLATAWEEWTRIEGASNEVLPYVFPVRGMVSGYPKSVVGRAGYHMHDLWAPVGQRSYEAAVASANLAVAAAAEVLAGRDQVYALCRPSGHHAYADMGGGSCFLNNAAIAAQYLLRDKRRVAIVDVDVHHGNGTQGIFYHRDDVLFVSLHRDPVDYHPFFVGYASERGEAAGLGYNLNLPLPAHSPDDVVLAALETACRRIVTCGAEALVVSLGVDGHEHDPTNGLGISFDGFRRIGARLAELGLPTVVIQEGGYNTATIGPCVVNALAGFEGKAVP
jgi:acetoin utilization deacetylase AcuC-like enzyme